MAQELKTKQAAITPKDIQANAAPVRFRVKGFVGSYHGYFFDDDGKIDKPMDPETFDLFKSQWPKADIEEL